MGQIGYNQSIRQRISCIHVIHRMWITLTGFSLFVTSACQTNDTEGRDKSMGKVIARVFEYKLYSSEVNDLVSAGVSAQDSERIVDNYINAWVREMLLVKKAEQNLSAEQKDVEKQLRAYRNSLIIYNYEKALIQQRLDTLVSDAEIETYYQEHPKDFALKDNIVKVRYVKVNKNAPNISKLKDWMRSDKTEDQANLAGYCAQFASNYYLDQNAWLLFDDLLKEVPIVTYNSQLFLQNNRDVEVRDSTTVYLLHINGYMMRNSRSPLTFEKNNIRAIILNKRKRELIDKMRNDLYHEALENKDIEIKTKES